MAKRPGKHSLTFPARASVDDIARSVVSEQARALQQAIKQARSSRDPEHLHQLRVSVRKLRVVLRTFESRLDASAVRSLTRDLRWLFQRLGAVREYDVLLHDLALETDDESDPELAVLRGELLRRREATTRAAGRAMASARYARLRRALRSLPAAVDDARARDDKPAKRWARKRLKKRLARVRELHDASSSGAVQPLHELRKALKKLRYVADILAPLWPRRRVKAYLQPLEELQDLLGTLNDTAVGERLLSAAGARVAEAAHAAERRASVLRATAEPARQRFARKMRRFARMKPFWS